MSRNARRNRATYELHDLAGWPRGHFGPVRRRSVDEVVFRNGWDPDRADIVYGAGARPDPKT
jgi:hypothetical protein